MIGRNGPGRASEVAAAGVDDPTASTAVMDNSMAVVQKSLIDLLTFSVDRCALAQGYACDDHAARVQGRTSSAVQNSRLLLVIPDGAAVEIGCLAIKTWEVAVVGAGEGVDDEVACVRDPGPWLESQCASPPESPGGSRVRCGHSRSPKKQVCRSGKREAVEVRHQRGN